MPIAAVDTALYRIQLPVPLSDSTHGTMTHFELVTVRVRDNDGAEGVGYTYTTGAGGAAVHALIGCDPEVPCYTSPPSRRLSRHGRTCSGHLRTGRRSADGSILSRIGNTPAASIWSSPWTRC